VRIYKVGWWVPKALRVVIDTDKDAYADMPDNSLSQTLVQAESHLTRAQPGLLADFNLSEPEQQRGNGSISAEKEVTSCINGNVSPQGADLGLNGGRIQHAVYPQTGNFNRNHFESSLTPHRIDLFHAQPERELHGSNRQNDDNLYQSAQARSSVLGHKRQRSSDNKQGSRLKVGGGQIHPRPNVPNNVPVHGSPSSQQLRSHEPGIDQDRQEEPIRVRRLGKETRREAIALKRWHCSEHNLSSGTKSDLTRHYKEKHGQDLAGNPVTPFSCHISGCGRSFNRKTNLEKHTQSCHQNLPVAARTGKAAKPASSSEPATETIPRPSVIQGVTSIRPRVEPSHPPIGATPIRSIALDDTENTDDERIAGSLHARHQRFLWHKRYIKMMKLEYKSLEAEGERLELYVNAVQHWLDNQSNPEQVAHDRSIYERTCNQLAENSSRLQALKAHIEMEENRNFEPVDWYQSSEDPHSGELATSQGM
jgi:hypothetical protein